MKPKALKEHYTLNKLTTLDWRELNESERLTYQGIFDMDNARIAYTGNDYSCYVVADGSLEVYQGEEPDPDCYNLQLLEENA
jgi:hypothetical protein